MMLFVVSADKPEPDEKTERQILTCQQLIDARKILNSSMVVGRATSCLISILNYLDIGTSTQGDEAPL
jgi:hypothetical protein